jgi:hypothetical protein
LQTQLSAANAAVATADQIVSDLSQQLARAKATEEDAARALEAAEAAEAYTTAVRGLLSAATRYLAEGAFSLPLAIFAVGHLQTAAAPLEGEELPPLGLVAAALFSAGLHSAWQQTESFPDELADMLHACQGLTVPIIVPASAPSTIQVPASAPDPAISPLTALNAELFADADDEWEYEASSVDESHASPLPVDLPLADVVLLATLFPMFHRFLEDGKPLDVPTGTALLRSIVSAVDRVPLSPAAATAYAALVPPLARAALAALLESPSLFSAAAALFIAAEGPHADPAARTHMVETVLAAHLAARADQPLHPTDLSLFAECTAALAPAIPALAELFLRPACQLCRDRGVDAAAIASLNADSAPGVFAQLGDLLVFPLPTAAASLAGPLTALPARVAWLSVSDPEAGLRLARAVVAALDRSLPGVSEAAAPLRLLAAASRVAQAAIASTKPKAPP